ncbi:MlaD family protein [Neptunicella sp. SCSIO 80796]|uniref:MlaD family protein n=1 Tax=Neptunicella plasticusilytica TaxID=3117012 RepID=UPI003A4D67E0
MTEATKAVIKPSGKYMWLWLVPVLAIGLVAFMVWRNLPENGESITLYFDDVNGLKEKQTKLLYRGLEVGNLEKLNLSDDKQKVKATVQVHEKIVPLLNEGSQFWLVKPQIGSAGISGINTLVSGPYITFSAGSGKPQQEFHALQQQPIEKREGLKFRIWSELRSSISPGDDLYYKQVPVGKIYAYELLSDHLLFYAQIQPEYQSLLRSNSRFWEESGFEFDMGLLGMSVSTAPLMSLLSGGISFATPTEYGAQAKVNDQFVLEEDGDEDWLKWQPQIKLPEHIIKESGQQDSQSGLVPKTLQSGVKQQEKSEN